MKKRAIRYALYFLIAGVLLTILIGFVQRRTIGTYEENLPFISLGESVKNRTVQAHLKLEQYLGGEGSIKLENDITPPLTSSIELLQAAYDGKESSLGKFRKLDNEDTRAILKETILGVEKLLAISAERYKAAEERQKASAQVETDSTGAPIPPPPVDPAILKNEAAKFMTQFDQVQAMTDRLVTHVNDEARSDRASLQRYSWFSLFALIVSSLGLAFVVYKLQEKSDRIVLDNSERIQQQERSVTSLSSFIESISAGNFNVELHLEGENNLSGTLLKMRDKLRENAENDRKRNWSTSGLAQIGEILRANTSSTTELYDNILKFVVKYTRSNQGGLFLLNEENEADRYLDLVACYAFERKKYLQKKAALGEGLIGQCYLEGQRIYLVEVPQEYIRITSGLGGSNPNALLIVPLKVNEKIYGVLELATFGKYEEYEIELVEKLAETIASTISTVKINESTRILLEKTQQQAEEMRAQEEEMRQNMEELEATQEEMRRKEKHIEVMLESEKHRNEFNNKGRQLVIELSKSKDLLEGKWEASIERITKSVGDHLKISRVSIFAYEPSRGEMLCEKTFHFDRKNFSGGAVVKEKDAPNYFRSIASEKIIIAKDATTSAETRDLATSYLAPNRIASLLSVPYFSEGRVAGFVSCEHTSPMDWSDDFIEFLKSCADLLTVTKNTVRINSMVTSLSEAQETLQTIIDNLPRAVFWKDRDLRIQGCNRIFANVAGLKSHLDLIGKTDFDMPWKDHAEAYRADDLQVMNSRIARIDQEEKNVNSEGKESWVLTSKVPVLNKEGEVVAVLGMFEDITDRKRREADVEMKLKELDRLRNMLENQKN
jgi:PAS domain S-box-containing protein